MATSVVIEVRVINWKQVHEKGPDYESRHWFPTLECGHDYLMQFHPGKDGLPTEINCYGCGDIARTALKRE